MIGLVERLLREIPTPATEGLFHVAQMPAHPACYVGRDAAGHAALLVRVVGEGRTVPLRLAGIDARFGIPCKIATPGSPERTERVSAIVCVSHERGIETYFANAAESLVALLDEEPSASEIDEAVQRLVDLFQKLRKPARRPLAGLVGEICVIQAARDAAAAVAAWRADPNDRYDFVAGRVRLDVKSSTSRSRLHGVSFEQANPPPGCIGLLASVWIEAAGGGTSLTELLGTVEARLGTSHAAIARLRTVVADTLGETVLYAMEWRFDLDVARSSIAFYDPAAVPAVRPPLPSGVSAVRFVSDFEACSRADIAALAARIDPAEAAVLPIVASTR